MSKSIFYCDRTGTYKATDKEVEDPSIRERSLQRFARALDVLCEANGEEEIYFGFISTDNIECIIEAIKEFMPYVKNSKHVRFGTSFSEKKKIIGTNVENILPCSANDKISQIIRNINHVNHDVDYHFHASIDKIFFADDHFLQHKVLSHYIKNRLKEIQLIDFVPGEERQENEMYGVDTPSLEGVIGSILKYAKAKNFINSFNISDEKFKTIEHNVHENSTAGV